MICLPFSRSCGLVSCIHCLQGTAENSLGLRSAASHPLEANCAYIPSRKQSFSWPRHPSVLRNPSKLPACLETRQRSRSCLHRHKHTRTHTDAHQPAFIFLNQMCFYWAQFRFPQCFKYVLGFSDSSLPVFNGEANSFLVA